MIGNNDHYIYFDDKYLLGKSSPESDAFDVLLFARRDIEFAYIPSFIKRIGPYSFEKCKSLNIVEISSDSKLEIIDKYAFCFSSVSSISKQMIFQQY